MSGSFVVTTVGPGAVLRLFIRCRAWPPDLGARRQGTDSSTQESGFVADQGGEQMTVIAMHVPDMGCRRCVRLVTARLRDLPGVVTVEADARTAELVLHGDVTEDQVRGALAEVALPRNGGGHDEESAFG
jgi:copper chaperone CopZ